MTKETVTSICGICPGGCGVNVVLVDGKVEKNIKLSDSQLELRLQEYADYFGDAGMTMVQRSIYIPRGPTAS